MKPANETKTDRFVRVVEARVNKIIKMIRLIGNCSNTANYEYTTENIDQIFDTLHEELNKTKKRFMLVKSGKSRFSLSDEPEAQYSYSVSGNNTLYIWENDAIMAELSGVTEKQAESLFKEVVYEMRSIDLDEIEPKGES